MGDGRWEMGERGRGSRTEIPPHPEERGRGGKRGERRGERGWGARTEVPPHPGPLPEERELPLSALLSSLSLENERGLSFFRRGCRGGRCSAAFRPGGGGGTFCLIPLLR